MIFTVVSAGGSADAGPSVDDPGNVDQLQVFLTLDAATAARPLGLFIPMAEDFAVSVNGRRLEAEPVFRTDGTAYMIARFLQEGDNTLVVQRMPKMGSPADWVGTRMFTLHEIEEMHFGPAVIDAAPVTKDSQPPTADQEKYDALWYNLIIEPDVQACKDNSAPNTVRRALATRISSATLTMGAKNVSAAPLSLLVMDFDHNADFNAGQSPLSPDDLDIDLITEGPGGPVVNTWSYQADNKLHIPLSVPIQPNDEFQIQIVYHGYPNVIYTTPGGYNQIAQALTATTHNNGIPVIYAANQPFGARRWFPCKDVAIDKASSSSISIIVPYRDDLNPDLLNDYGTMSNGLLKAEIFRAGVAGTETGTTSSEVHVWESEYGIPTYLMSFYVSNYHYSDGETHTNLDNSVMPIQHAIYPEHIATEGNAAPGTRTILSVYSSLYGDYPFRTEKYGTASWNITFGIENQNATGMPHNGITANSLGNGLTDRNIHEIAHQWWGDNVTYSDFDHLWLGEGFATHSEALFRQFRPGGTFADYKSRMAFYYNSAVASPATALVSAAGEGVLNNTYYRRGAWVAHMLRRVLGDETYFDVCRAYHTQLALSSTNSAGFQAVAESESGQDLDWFFNQWLYRTNQASAPTFPNYRFTANLTKPGTDYVLNLNVEQVQGGTAGNAFVMPLDFHVTDGVNPTTVTVQNNDYSQNFGITLGTTLPLEIDFDPDEWVLRLKSQVSINTLGLQNGTQWQAYSRTLRATGGGVGISWSATGLPPGMTLSSAGVLSGVPTAAGTYSIQVTATGSTVAITTLSLTIDPGGPAAFIARRGHANNARNGFCYFYSTLAGAVDILNGGTQPAALGTGTSGLDTRDIAFNPASTTGQSTVIISEDDDNELIVCRADNGSQLHVLANAAAGAGAVDPYGVAVSEDGVIFTNGFDRSVAYWNNDSAGATKTILLNGGAVNGGVGNSRMLHITGNVGAGTCRLYLSAGSNLVIYDVRGTLPSSLTTTHVFTYTSNGTGGPITDIPAIAGTVDLIHIADNTGNARDALAVQPGPDNNVNTSDDTYIDAQSVANNQVGQAYSSTGLAVLDNAIYNIGVSGAGSGLYALCEVDGLNDGVIVGSLGTAGSPATLAGPPNGQLNDALVSVDEDYDDDGAWDGGISDANGGINGSSGSGSCDAAVFNGELNVWFVFAGSATGSTSGAFGRLVLPQSSVPVKLSGFVIE